MYTDHDNVSFVFKIFFCGSEMWTIIAEGQRKIGSFEIEAFEKMLRRISWLEKRTDESILKDLSISLKAVFHLPPAKRSNYLANLSTERQSRENYGPRKSERAKILRKLPNVMNSQDAEKTQTGHWELIHEAEHRVRWRVRSPQLSTLKEEADDD